MAMSDPVTLGFLRDPASYGVNVAAVEVIETHMSWVFLVADHAFKLKKPLHNAYLDFRSMAARCHACQQELQLNRRLAPSVYLSVEPISLNIRGALQFGPGIQQIDCVVKMRRIPAHQMLDDYLRRGLIQPRLLQQVAARIAGFHQVLPALDPEPAEWRAALHDQIDQNEHTLSAYPQYLNVSRLRQLILAQRCFLRAHAAWIDARIHQGKIIEAHGDLRAEHVFINNGVGAIDCLEFSAALRQLDRADEIAFLALDCERLAGTVIAQQLLQAYLHISGDDPPVALLHFYQSLRAAVRARLAILHLTDLGAHPAATWVARARQWLALASQHAARCYSIPPIDC